MVTGDLCLLFVKIDLVILAQGVGPMITASDKLVSSPEDSSVVSSSFPAFALEADERKFFPCFSLELCLIGTFFLVSFDELVFPPLFLCFSCWLVISLNKGSSESLLL